MYQQHNLFLMLELTLTFFAGVLMWMVIWLRQYIRLANISLLTNHFFPGAGRCISWSRVYDNDVLLGVYSILMRPGFNQMGREAPQTPEASQVSEPATLSSCKTKRLGQSFITFRVTFVNWDCSGIGTNPGGPDPAQKRKKKFCFENFTLFAVPEGDIWLLLPRK